MYVFIWIEHCIIDYYYLVRYFLYVIFTILNILLKNSNFIRKYFFFINNQCNFKNCACKEKKNFYRFSFVCSLMMLCFSYEEFQNAILYTEEIPFNKIPRNYLLNFDFKHHYKLYFWAYVSAFQKLHK